LFYKAGLTLLSASLLLVTACKSPEQKAAEETAKRLDEASKQMAEASKNGQVNMGAAMNALGAAMGAANGGKKVETVDYKVLKDMLPESIGNMKRTEATGERTAAMGMQISNAEGRYSGDDGASITVKLTDIGSMTGLAGMAAYAWAATDIDRESDTGYEKTSTYNGFKSHEKWDKSSKSGDISVLVGSRFVADVSGYNVEMDALKDALNKLDLKKLDGMKNVGVQ
jgi:hypothetical protein